MALLREDGLIKRFWSHCAFLSIIIVLTFLGYSNVLHGEPIFDDYLFIDSLLLQSPHSFKDLDLWDAFKGGMRPVTSFTFSLNYYFFGKDTFSYHLTNLFIHIINGILVYVFIYITLTLPSKSSNAPALRLPLFSKEGIRGELVLRWTAFLTALLFSLHPIQTESVSYIYQRAESLSSLFYLASLISFIIAAGKSEGKGLITSIICYLIFILGFLLALGSKEIAITLPATAVIYGLFFFEKKGLWKKVAIPGLLILAGLMVAAVRLTTLGEDPSAGYYLKEFTAWEYLLTQFSAITNYLRLLVLPVGQNIDHAYPVSRSILEARTVLSIAFLFSLLVVASILYRRWRAGSFFILWFFIVLLPSSSIVPLKDLLVEHRVYLPSIGLFFILATGMVWTYEMFRRRRSLLIAHCLLLIAVFTALWSATYSRNLLWSSEIDIWNDSISKSPLNARTHNNIGVAYNAKGMYDKAIEHDQTALRLKPGYAEAHHNLGLAYKNKGWLDKAIEQFETAVRLRPYYYPEAHNNLGLAYHARGLFDKAIEQYQIVVRLKPDLLQIKNNLGIAYLNKGLFDKAIEQFDVVLRSNPDHLEARNNLGNCYLLLHDYKTALKEYLKALRVDPKYFDAYYNVGLSLRRVGEPDIATEFFVAFVRYGPDKYANEKRELAQKYNITKDTALQDIDLLIDRATKALNQLGDSD